MKSWKMYCAGLVLAAGLAPVALAQLPAITPPPGVPIAPQPQPVNGPVPPTAAPPNIWDKVCPRADQCAAIRAKICNCPLGQLLNNMLAPAAAFSGGIAGPFCPTINAADLAKPADCAEGAAARLKLDQADAAARRAAIRYMAGADCHYWPEVTDALIGALRADRNECVRLEAALALGRGCCCNRATMLALTLTVSSATDDGNPPEDSERVKMAALAALNHCLACYTEVVPAPEAVPVKPPDHGEPIPPKGEPLPPPMPKPGETLPSTLPPASGMRPKYPTEYYHRAENLEEKKVLEAARRAVSHVSPVVETAPSPAADHSLVGIVRASWTTVPGPSGTVVTTEPAISATPTAEKPMANTRIIVPASMLQPPKTSPDEMPEPSPTPPPLPAPPAPAASPSMVPARATPAPALAPMAPATPPHAAAPAPAPTWVSPAAYSAPAAKITAPVPTGVPTLAATAAKPMPAPHAVISAAAAAAAMNVLRDSIYPEEREKAAATLGACDGMTSPNVVRALVEAARSDGAGVVRAACMRSLGQMNVHTVPVASVAETLKSDPDPRVRNEAEQALKQMGSSSRSQ